MVSPILIITEFVEKKRRRGNIFITKNYKDFEHEAVERGFRADVFYRY